MTSGDSRPSSGNTYRNTKSSENEGQLAAWKDAILSRLKQMPNWQTAKWGGDKDGWGFNFEFIGWMDMVGEQTRSWDGKHLQTKTLTFNQMKNLVMVLIAIMLSSLLVGAGVVTHRTLTRHVTLSDYSGAKLSLVEMGGCEYVVMTGATSQSGMAIVHHAACQNSCHGNK